MKHAIDPKVDCVFKAILGAEEHVNLLIHFLNAMLGSELGSPIVAVEILNPYNDKEMLDEKLSIVDIKARDEAQRMYQIEIQLLNYSNIPARMAYTWADIYSKQLKEGENYRELKPTYSIWLMDARVIQDDEKYVHNFKLRDENGKVLLDNGGIWVVELPKFDETAVVTTEEARWIRLFKEGEKLDNTQLPEWMHTPEMEQVMNVIKRFSEKEADYHLYQSRQNYLRQQKTIQLELETEKQQKQAALIRMEAAMRREKAALREKEAAMQREETEKAAKEAEKAAKEAALQREQEKEAEIERLKALLAQKN
ncbi:MAG: Rpn family recombination-promoting nuclease/putative transposase [Nitrospira sp.]|nr:Rpn family recombination-promoting nuclease/putative transposase [Nitrospira sp.]